MNTSRFATVVACVALPFLAGCEGVRFANNAAPVNVTPPSELRTVVPAAGYRTDLSTLVGTIAVYNKSDKSLQVLEQIYDRYDPRTRPVVENVNTPIYKSLVTKNMQTDVPIIAAAMRDASPDTLELEVVDEAHGTVPRYFTDILNFFASKYRPTNADEELVYVSEVHLRHLKAAKLTPTAIHERSAAAPVIGYNGSVYTRTDNFKDEYYLSVSVVPFARIGAIKPGEQLEPYPQGTIATIKPPVANPQAYYVPGGWRGYGNGYGGYGYGAYNYYNSNYYNNGSYTPAKR